MCVPKDHYTPLLEYLIKLLELKNCIPEPTAPSGKSKALASGAKPQTTAETVPVESALVASIPSSVIKNRTSPETATSSVHSDIAAIPELPETSLPAVSICPKDSQPESVSVLETQTPLQSMELPLIEAERLPHLESQQGQSEPQQLQPQQEEYQQLSYQQHSPPVYKQPQQETVYQEQKQEAEQQQEFPQEQEYDQHQHQQFQQPQQQQPYQQQPHYQQQIEEYQGEQKCEEEPQEEYREPPPNYHQQHFTIPTGYMHEEPKIPLPFEERLSVLETPQVEEESQGTSHFPENIPIDPWGGLRHNEPPHKGNVGEVEVLQSMDVDAQS